MHTQLYKDEHIPQLKAELKSLGIAALKGMSKLSREIDADGLVVLVTKADGSPVTRLAGGKLVSGDAFIAIQDTMPKAATPYLVVKGEFSVAEEASIVRAISAHVPVIPTREELQAQANLAELRSPGMKAMIKRQAKVEGKTPKQVEDETLAEMTE